MTAKSRALRLVERIQRAIESGSFTPEKTYFIVSDVLGPCGCAVGAVAFLAGGTEREDDFDVCARKKLLTENEARSFEAGYEDYSYRLEHDQVFYNAGKSLRGFRPSYGGAS